MAGMSADDQPHPVLPLTMAEVEYVIAIQVGVDCGTIPQAEVGARYAAYLGPEKADELLDFVRAYPDEAGDE